MHKTLSRALQPKLDRENIYLGEDGTLGIGLAVVLCTRGFMRLAGWKKSSHRLAGPDTHDASPTAQYR